MNAHFRLEILGPNEWRFVGGERSADYGDRPAIHLVPRSEEARLWLGRAIRPEDSEFLHIPIISRVLEPSVVPDRYLLYAIRIDAACDTRSAWDVLQRVNQHLETSIIPKLRRSA